ncbi:glutathione S-transferase family protein [Kangiella marina]|uniref:Glutathione S-transferase family protein n=1 Tax=Kangiella marina TaxID=1079178 RepID=A0ABP8IJA4_9GAMM
MKEIILTTFDWVPEVPRGYVRDIRASWAMEEAGLAYRIEGVPFKNRNKEHLENQPFGQVPWLKDGEFTIFESGAMLLHIAERSENLIPNEPIGRSQVIQWLFAALNSIEMASVPWSLFKFSNDNEETPGRENLNNFLESRLQRMESVLAEREWLVNDFSIADIAMSDVLRLVDRFGELSDYPACKDYVERATARPAFKKAYADQLAHFAMADRFNQ